MKTQINTLISGTSTVVGTSRTMREAIGSKILAENGNTLHIVVKGIKLELKLDLSRSGKSWCWNTELTAEQYAAITDDCTLGISRKINSFSLTISSDCHVKMCVVHRENERQQWKLGYEAGISEKNITIL